MSREVTGDSIATNDSKILDALNSRYTCIHEPLVSSSDYSTPSYNRRYLTSLKVFVNREVDQPQSPTSTSKFISQLHFIFDLIPDIFVDYY